MSTRRDILKGLAAVPLLRMGRSQGLILPGGSAGGGGYVPWTPAYYQNFDSFSPGSHSVLNSYNVSAVDNAEAYSTPNSGRVDIASGSTAPGGAAQELVTVQPTLGNEVWFRVRTFFPVGYDFTARGLGSANGLKFMRVACNTGHIDWYLTGGGPTNVGYFEFIREGVAIYMWGDVQPNPMPSGIVRGQWQTWEVYYKLSNVAANAIIRMWRDGTLICDTSRGFPTGTGFPSGPPQLATLKNSTDYVGNFASALGGFMFITYWNGGAPQAQSCWVDDFTIATDVQGELPPYFDSVGNRYIGMPNPS